MVVLAEGIDLYAKMTAIAKYHNETAKRFTAAHFYRSQLFSRRDVTLACYSSGDFLEGYRDVAYFFPSCE